MGRPPAYVHHHSLVSPVTDAVVRAVGAENGVAFVDDLYRTGGVPLLPNDWYASPFPLEVQAHANARGAIELLLPEILARELSLLIAHPCYVDAELIDISTYSVIHARDMELMTAPENRRILEDAGVELTTFSAAGLA